MPDVSELRVYGDVGGQIVVGSRNVVINAQQGSSVTYRPEEPPAVRRRASPAGWALPRQAGAVLGREDELANLGAWLDDGHTVRVHGMPGIGKTALLRRFAAERSARDGASVYLSAAGMPVEDILQDVFYAFYETDDYKPEPSRMRRLMGAVHALVVVDDFEGSDEDAAVLVDAVPGCEVVVAGVEHRTWTEGRVLRLAGLGEEAARALLARELGRQPEGAERAAADRLIAAANGHPRTLVQAAAGAANCGAAATGPAATVERGTPSERAAAGQAAAEARLEPDDSVRAVGVAGQLSRDAARVLAVVCAVEPLPVSPALLRALAGDTEPSAIAELQTLRLLLAEGAGNRSCGPFAAEVVRCAGAAVAPADLAAPLLRWLRSTAVRHDAAAGAAVVHQVLEAAAGRGDHAAVRDVARIVAPVLARSLRWGTWRSVLALGGAAAHELGADSDAAYFAHEEEVRKRALGLAAGVLLGAGGGTGAVLLHSAAAGGSKAAKLKAAASHPAGIGLATTLVVAGGIFTAMAATGGTETEPPPAAASSASHLPELSEPPPTTGKPTAEKPTTAAPPSPSTTSPGSDPRAHPPSGAETCVPTTIPPPGFGQVPVGESETRTVSFTTWLPCDDEQTLSVDDDVNWSVALTACPPPPGSRTCRFTVTFEPTQPGARHAEVTMLDDWGQDDVSMTVTAVAVAPGSDEPSGPTKPSGPEDPSDPGRPSGPTPPPEEPVPLSPSGSFTDSP
ncbi:hypothetical protein [Streptomyces sp. 184]|uniref:hypothetical protein n=1 Tax=Streptomyces sp. 184 TaxID=1827526 RepID=UPI00389289B7